jgi:hypothetical protein
MTTDLATIRQRAREHQAEIDLAVRFLSPKTVAERWGVSVTAVLNIPPDELPFTVINAGKVKHHRRYNPADVLDYETRGDAADEPRALAVPWHRPPRSRVRGGGLLCRAWS